MIWLINFFKELVTTIFALIDWVVSLFTGLIDFIMALPTFLATIYNSFAGIPDFVLPFLYLSVTISIIYFILGRGRSN